MHTPTPELSDSCARKRPLESGPETMARTKRQTEQAARTIHEPLAEGSMRLLRIVTASNAEETISCETIHVLFGEKRKFEALSYRWGESMAEKPILLNGVEIKVRQNLRDALCILRRRAGSDKLYWIDALCINQDDVAERNLHLQLMHSIFFRASTVLVWLGKMYDQYEPTVSLLQGFEDAEQSKRSEKHLSRMKEEIKANSLEMAENIYEDQYWNRVWIVQEIGLARRIEVCLGETSINWSAFHQALYSSQDGRLPRPFEVEFNKGK